MMAYIFWVGALLCLLAGNYQWLQDNKQTEVETTYVYTVLDKDGNVVWQGNGIRPNIDAIRAIVKEKTK